MSKHPEITDLVPRDATEASEIGFTVPERYNASSILFHNLSEGRQDKTAVIDWRESLTYGELCERACRLGSGLLGMGLDRGDRVLLLLEDSADYAAAVFGALRAGLVPVLINTLSPADLVRYFAEDSDARAALVHKAYEPLLEAIDAEAVVLDSSDGRDWLNQQSAALTVAGTHRDDMAFWMYSSGSTGRPKGVVHLHHDMAYTVQSYARHVLEIGEEDVCFSVPKIFFAYGFGNSLSFPFAVGACSTLLPERPTPERIFEHIRRFKPTLFFALPTVYTALIKYEQAQVADLSSIRRCISAAEVLSSEVFNAWKERYGREIIEGLGSTEVLHIYLSNSEAWKKPGAAGLRVPGYALKLTDLDGRETASGEEGILWVRGDSNAPCYWGRPDKTAETMRDGWIWTGDRFFRDADDFYFFRGRADDLVKVSGQWVYPLEIELCLNEHPHVVESAVFAYELADGRTSIGAVVALSGGKGTRESDRLLVDYVKTSLLPYKYPRRIVYLESLPKTGTDKIDRQRCRRILLEEGNDGVSSKSSGDPAP